jgi:hypothetical protein
MPRRVASSTTTMSIPLATMAATSPWLRATTTTTTNNEYVKDGDIADNDKEYAIGKNGVNKPLAEGNDNDDNNVPIATADNNEPITDNISNEYAKGNEDAQYAKGKDNNEYAIGNDSVNEPLDKGKNKDYTPIAAANNDEPLTNNISNEYAKGDEDDKYTRGKDVANMPGATTTRITPRARTTTISPKTSPSMTKMTTSAPGGGGRTITTDTEAAQWEAMQDGWQWQT